MAIVSSVSSIKNIFFFQPTLVVLHSIRVGFHKEQVSIPFYSNCIFETPEEASFYLPEFIKTLKAEHILTDEDVANPDLYKTGIAKITVSHLEQR